MNSEKQDHGQVIQNPVWDIETDFPNLSTRSTTQAKTITSPEKPDRAQRLALIEGSGVLDFRGEGQAV